MWQWFFAYFARNARCILTTHLLVWYSPPERPFSHYIHSHGLAAEMWTTMKNNVLGKKKKFSRSFYLYRFRKYVSHGFPIIHFCNPGVHYETPCIERAHIHVSGHICILREEGPSDPLGSHLFLPPSRDSYSLRHKNQTVASFAYGIPNFFLASLWSHLWLGPCVTFAAACACCIAIENVTKF
jgi:hypothetical protein